VAGGLISSKGDMLVLFLSLLGAGLIFSFLAFLPLILRKRLPEDFSNELAAMDGNEPSKKSLPSPLIVILFFLIICLVSVFGYFAYSRGRAEVLELDKILWELEQVESSLAAKASKYEEFKKQFARIRETAVDLFGERKIATLESDLCETWLLLAKPLSFEIDHCGPVQGTWTKLVFSGPEKNREKLYAVFEDDIHVVSIRAVLIRDLEKGRIKISFIVLDRYNNQIASAGKNHYPINLYPKTTFASELFFGQDVNNNKTKISQSLERIIDLEEKAKVVRGYKRKSSLLLLIINQQDNPKLKSISIKDKERYFTFDAEHIFPDAP